MIILDSTTKKLQVVLAGAIATNQLPVSASYADITTTTFIPGSNDTTTNSTTPVDIVLAPAASTSRQVKQVNIFNSDTIAATVTVQLISGASTRVILTVLLTPGERLEYVDCLGFRAYTSQGALKGSNTVAATQYSVRNLLINAEGNINQRVFVGGALSAGVYGYDRWKAGTGGCNVTISSGIFTHTSGSIVQVIESPGIANSIITFSAEDVSTPLSVSVGGTTGTIPAGSGRQYVNLTMGSGVTGNVTAQITATSATYSRPQIERGAIVGSFDYRPVGFELDLCQRYFEKSFPIDVAPAQNAGRTGAWAFTQVLGAAAQQYGQFVTYRTTKRITPTVTFYNPLAANAFAQNLNIGASCSATAASGDVGPAGFHFVITTAAGSASGQANIIHWTADAEL